MHKVCLVVVFNHKYNKNISILEKLYGERFQDIYYLVPFNAEAVDGVDSKRIITVYETSYCFQGYFAQAFDRFKSNKYSHYVIIGDDQILNPDINENNIIDILSLGKEESYIKNVVPYGDSTGDQSNKLFNILSAFRINVGVSYKCEIPSYEEAVVACERHGYPVSKKLPLKFFAHKGYIAPKYSMLTLFTILMNKGLRLPYPLYKSYADMLVIDSSSMGEFCRLCGVFAAMNIFIETAVPLAMILACKKIKLEEDLNGYYGVENWGSDIPALEEKCNLELSKLYEGFGEKVLYYHPIKLSRWKVNI